MSESADPIAAPLLHNTPASSGSVIPSIIINIEDPPGHQHCLPYRLLSDAFQRLGHWTRRTLVTPLLRLLNVPTIADWDLLEHHVYTCSRHLYDQLVVQDRNLRAVRRNQVVLQSSIRTLQEAPSDDAALQISSGETPPLPQQETTPLVPGYSTSHFTEWTSLLEGTITTLVEDDVIPLVDYFPQLDSSPSILLCSPSFHHLHYLPYLLIDLFFLTFPLILVFNFLHIFMYIFIQVPAVMFR